jgi:hypothetical protein
MISNSNYNFLNFVILLQFFACGNNANNNIDTSLAFKVGSISVTRYELQKNLKPMIDNYIEEFNAPPPDDSIKTWKNKFINKFYFAADAYEKGYYQDEMIENIVNDMACYMLTKKRGLVQQRLIKDEVNLDECDLPQLYERRRYNYYFDFIKFRNMDQLKKMLGDTLKIKTAKQFSSLMDSLKADPEILSKSVDGFPWPYALVWDICDEIYEMETGQISDFIQAKTGVYIVHLKKKELTEQESYEKFKQEFPRFYELAKGHWLINHNENRIIEKSKIQVNEDNFNILYNYISKMENKNQINRDSIKHILNEPILGYEIESRKVEKFILDFLNFYGRQVLKSAIESKEILKGYITRMVIEDYLLFEAERLELAKEEQFVLDRKNYKNSLVYRKYEQNELGIDPVTENDIINEYQKQKGNFLEPINGVYTVLEFDDDKLAYNALDELKKLVKEKSIEQFKPNELSGLVYHVLNDTINYQSCEFPDMIKRELQMSKSEIIGPEKIDDTFKLFWRLKHLETGYKPIEEVYDYLYRSIQKRMHDRAKAKLLPGLKQKYDLTIYNID